MTDRSGSLQRMVSRCGPNSVVIEYKGQRDYCGAGIEMGEDEIGKWFIQPDTGEKRHYRLKGVPEQTGGRVCIDRLPPMARDAVLGRLP